MSRRGYHLRRTRRQQASVPHSIAWSNSTASVSRSFSSRSPAIMDASSWMPRALSSRVWAKGPRTSLYYAHPYCASERGSNENANRLIRRFLPKGTPLSDLKQEDVDVLAMWINCYPRAIFGGQSSRSKTKALGFHFRKKKEACQ